MGPVWKFDEMWPSDYGVVIQEQSENLWNMVPVRKEKVVTFCRPAPTY